MFPRLEAVHMKSVLLYTTGIIVIFFALFANYYFQRDFLYGHELERSHFEYPLNYTVKNIPTSYYCTTSELNEILPGWDYRPIYLYRALPNCSRNIDLAKLESKKSP